MLRQDVKIALAVFGADRNSLCFQDELLGGDDSDMEGLVQILVLPLILVVPLILILEGTAWPKSQPVLLSELVMLNPLVEMVVALILLESLTSR